MKGLISREAFLTSNPNALVSALRALNWTLKMDISNRDAQLLSSLLSRVLPKAIPRLRHGEDILYRDPSLIVGQADLGHLPPVKDGCVVHGVAYTKTRPMKVFVSADDQENRKELALIHELLHAWDEVRGQVMDHHTLHLYAAAILSDIIHKIMPI